MSIVTDQLNEIFALSLKVNGAIFYHQSDCKIVNIYSFIPYTSEYKFRIEGSYSDYVGIKDQNSLYSVIKNLKELILSQP